MQTQRLYNVAEIPTDRELRASRVGLHHEHTGVPAFLLFLRGLETPLHRAIHSIEDIESEIYRFSDEHDKRAWQNCLPFFLSRGNSAHVIAQPLSDKRPLVDQMIGHERSLKCRTGIHPLKNLVHYADLVAIPQAAELSFEEHRAFYELAFELLAELQHFLVLVDFPRNARISDLEDWQRSITASNAAAYYPWIQNDGVTTPPSSLVAAAYQLNDQHFGLGDMPANRQIDSPFRPIFRMTPSQMSALQKNRINSVVIDRSGHPLLWGGSTLAHSTDTTRSCIVGERTLLAVREAIEQVCEPFVLEPAHADLPAMVEATVHSFLQSQTRLFHPDATVPFCVNASLQSRGKQDFVSVDLKYSIPYAVNEVSFSLNIQG